MNRELNLERVRQLLNRSTAQLDETTLTLLCEARTHALEQHASRHAHTLAFLGHGKPAAHWYAMGARHKPYLWAAGLLLVACIVSGIAYWQKVPNKDTSDVDIAILTDDLPLQVYID
jgi:Protein of unknown function (DUF3619)